MISTIGTTVQAGRTVRHERTHFLRACAIILSSGLLFGCSHVPKEAVQLSYQIGQDLPRLYESHDNLIRATYENLRARRNAYVDDVWAPQMLASFIDKGKLVDTAAGRVVWSADTASFVAPTPGKEKVQLLSTVSEWARAAVAKIERKRKTVLEPLDREEAELRKQVQEAFARVIQANAYITAHLASLRGVEETQDEVLAALKLKELRDSINSALAKASEGAAAGLEQIRKADGLVDKGGDALKYFQ